MLDLRDSIGDVWKIFKTVFSLLDERVDRERFPTVLWCTLRERIAVKLSVVQTSERVPVHCVLCTEECADIRELDLSTHNSEEVSVQCSTAHTTAMS